MTDQNLEIVRRGYDAFGRGDLDTLLSLFDQNIDWVTPGPAEMPTAGHRRGLQDVAGFFKILSETFEIERFEPKEFIVQGDRVVVIGEETARVKGGAKSFEFAWAHVFTMRDGKVVSFHEYGDTTAAVGELRAAHAVAG